MTPVETGILAEHAAQSALLVLAMKIIVQAAFPKEEHNEVLRNLELIGCNSVQSMPITGVPPDALPALREHAMMRVTDLVSAVAEILRNDDGQRA